MNLSRGDKASALSHLEQAIRYHRSVLTRNPENRLYRKGLADDLGVMAIVLRENGGIDRAADAAEELPRLLPDDFKIYGHAVAILIDCASAVAGDDRFAEDRRVELTERYQKRAVHLLRQAVIRGVILLPGQLDRDEFRPLRGRADFERLREGLKRANVLRLG